MFASSFWNYFTLTTEKPRCRTFPLPVGLGKSGPLLRELNEIPSATAHSHYQLFLLFFYTAMEQPLSTLKRRFRQVAQALEDL